jgi:hypothetical protein
MPTENIWALLIGLAAGFHAYKVWAFDERSLVKSVASLATVLLGGILALLLAGDGKMTWYLDGLSLGLIGGIVATRLGKVTGFPQTRSRFLSKFHKAKRS